ncbi:hypothetical protein EVAR_56018_1 [Eumeta japonica]|uniref:Uncharacterized protein n=1 Tax=Eumeta variegata TaxID=151549 RepID=A0A4C1YIY4_EUMVA|nr:hypothetical protein EVAR_56018_1 [Eumeta japonica]
MTYSLIELPNYKSLIQFRSRAVPIATPVRQNGFSKSYFPLWNRGRFISRSRHSESCERSLERPHQVLHRRIGLLASAGGAASVRYSLDIA